MIKMPPSYAGAQALSAEETRRIAPFIFLPRYMSLLLPPQGSAVAAAAAVAFSNSPPQTNVISTEADHSLIVSSAVERPLYFAFPAPYF
jgi:hypothetical protein